MFCPDSFQWLVDTSGKTHVWMDLLETEAAKHWEHGVKAMLRNEWKRHWSKQDGETKDEYVRRRERAIERGELTPDYRDQPLETGD